MTDHSEIEIRDTAFLTCTLRSYEEELSKDIFAKLWVDERQNIWIKKYLDLLSYEEVWTHCFRNRYFLETIEHLAKAGKIKTLINFGCGLSMYPYLIDEKLEYIEIDTPQLIDYKKAHIENWQSEGILPQRDVHHIGVDFNEEYQEKLAKLIGEITQGKPSFILIEGVLFFLTQELIKGLFDFFDSVQTSGSYIGSVSFQDIIAEKPGYKKLISFMKLVVPGSDESNYQTLPDSFYTSRKNYRLIDHQDYFTMSKKHDHLIRLAEDEILNENFYLLEKR